MCGIAGIIMYNQNRTESQLEYIRGLATELAVENERRGSDACGIATFNEHGEYAVFKKDLPASSLTSYRSWEDFVDINIDSTTTNILIHTRAATQGSPSNNANNHPIETATSIGIHNGWVSNDFELFTEENMFRQAEVDSEAIFRLVDNNVGATIDNIKYVAEKVEGVFAVAYVIKEDPKTLNYFRTSNPTTFILIPTLGIIAYASKAEYLANALSTINISNGATGDDFLVDLQEDVFDMEPAECSILQFNTDNDIAEDFYQLEVKFEESYSSLYGGNWYKQNQFYGWDNEWKDEASTIDESETLYDYLEDVLASRLTHDEYAKTIALIEKLENNMWSKGWKKGRESADSDITIIKEKIRKEHEAELLELMEEIVEREEEKINREATS